MSKRKQRLMLQQVSQQLAGIDQAGLPPVPPEGWIRTIRKAIGMNLGQLARRMHKKPPSISDFEKREQEGTITLKSLQEIAEALDMKLVYAIIPKEGNLEGIVRKAAHAKAAEIINRTSTTMGLEDQQNNEGRLINARNEKISEFMNEMPKFLWD